MTEIKVKDKTYLFVEVPDDAYDFRYKNMPDDTQQLVGTIKDNSGNVGTCYIIENPIGQIISTTKDITEEQAESIVEDCDIYAKCWIKYDYYGERDKGGRFNAAYSCWTAKESLHSLLQAYKLDINKNYLILLKSNQNAKEI